MGVPGFSTWFSRTACPQAFQDHHGKRFDHVFVDVASILHTVLRHGELCTDWKLHISVFVLSRKGGRMGRNCGPQLSRLPKHGDKFADGTEIKHFVPQLAPLVICTDCCTASWTGFSTATSLGRAC